jgi:hypothetical protein
VTHNAGKHRDREAVRGLDALGQQISTNRFAGR